MEQLFFEVLNRGLTASLLVLAVLVIRLLFQRAPKSYRLILWALVAFRLLCPFSLESAFSLVPDFNMGMETSLPNVGKEKLSVQNGFSVTENVPVSKNEGAENNQEFEHKASPEVSGAKEIISSKVQTQTNRQNIQLVVSYVWLAGIIAMTLYGVISYFKVKHQVRVSLHDKENIYYCDDIETPFTFGMFHAKIYLPSGLNETIEKHVICHEKEHLRCKDQWWKLLGFLLLSGYWFHPLLWLAYILFCKDIEYACDERVIKGLDEKSRKEYVTALLDCSIGKRVILFCPIAFGETSVKGRIQSVLCYKKATVPIFIAAVVLVVVVAVAFLTDTKEEVNPDETLQITLTPIPTPTNPPDTAYPLTIVNGKYVNFGSGRFTPIIPEYQELLDKAEYVGDNSSCPSNREPSKELESNCLPEGCKIYYYIDEESEVYIVVNQTGTQCIFSEEGEWRKFYKLGTSLIEEVMPTPAPTAVAMDLPFAEAPQHTWNQPQENISVDEEMVIKAYISVLERLLYEEELPEHDVEVDFSFAAHQKDYFAICDIDADGKDELYICHIATYNAGMFSAIYGYEDGKLHRELLADTLQSFYDNGIMIQKAMHNHGMAAGEDSEFWPYCLYQYDKGTDSYIAIANVEAWDKSYIETDWEGNEFPDEADVDGDGRVYYVMPGETYEQNEPMDNEEYQNWLNSYLEGATVRYKLPTVDLTEESIEELKKFVTTIPAQTPTPMVEETKDLLSLLEKNYDQYIPSSAASPYVLQADDLSGMIVFGTGETTLIYITTNGGATWKQAEIPPAGKTWHAVVTCATAISATEYCIGYRYWGEYDGTNFYLTTDSGSTWTRLAPEMAIPKEITENMRYAEAKDVVYVEDGIQVWVSCKTVTGVPWSIEVLLKSADFGNTWNVVTTWEKETDAE